MNIYDDQRPWGNERIFIQNQEATVKVLFIKAGGRLSLQYHNHRDEFTRILSGSPSITIGEKIVEAHAGDEFFIPRGTRHRISAGQEDVSILEISLGNFDEQDIVRLEDDYNRV